MIPEIAVVAMKTLSEPVLTSTVIVDGLKKKDRPAAVGYALFTLMRRSKQRHGSVSDITIRVGTIDARKLARYRSENSGNDTLNEVITPICQDGEYGSIYELIAAVENGRWDIFGS